MSLDIFRAGSAGTKAAGSIARAATAAASPATSFADSLSKLVDSVEQTEGAANEAVVDMLDGKTEVHDAMIAMQRAEMTLQLTIQIRNKLVQAYQDVMRMPI
jgi:flagellar hook-basal body complex protein FliE